MDQNVQEKAKSLVGALKGCIADQQRQTVSVLTYLVEAQKEVLQFEVGVLEDVLKILKANGAEQQASEA